MVDTRSRFSAASVFAFAFPAKPKSARIVNTFESVFAFSFFSSLTLSKVNTWMLDDESFGNSVEIALIAD